MSDKKLSNLKVQPLQTALIKAAAHRFACHHHASQKDLLCFKEGPNEKPASCELVVPQYHGIFRQWHSLTHLSVPAKPKAINLGATRTSSARTRRSAAGLSLARRTAARMPKWFPAGLLLPSGGCL